MNDISFIHFIYTSIKNFKMKPHQTVMLLAGLLGMASCKKESYSTQYAKDAALESETLSNQQSCPQIDPSDFVKGIHNPYLSFVPGKRFYYVNKIVEDKELIIEHNPVVVTSDIKMILGVACTVVHDVVKVDGKITEDTYDWYAQDKHGNVWYFGEDTKSYENGHVSTEGSWEAGVNGAKPGIAMFGNPKKHIGETYYQEYLKGVAEDEATLISTNSTVKVAYGTFKNCVKTKEFTRLEPGVVEIKYYAKGVGEVLMVATKGENERDELINITH